MLRRIHDRMHGLGAGGADADLAMDMVRLLVAKVHSERCGTPFGTAAEIRAAFTNMQADHSDVFGPMEHITVNDSALRVAGEILGSISLIDPSDPDVNWPLLGAAYEEYTSTHLKRQRGQFFTQRRVVELLVTLINPQPGQIVLDPTAGSAGFLSGALRHVRALGGEPQLRAFEISPRLVKVAQASMILHGSSAQGFGVGDALAEWSKMDGQCGQGQAQRVLSNPPFAGTSDGRITEVETLRRFRTGYRWQIGPDGPEQSEVLLAEGAPPELLFLERCLDWLEPGGWLGIVLPKAVLDTQTYLGGRAVLFEQAHLRAVITLHRHAFQPHTGVQTCLLVAEKKVGPEVSQDGPIFMALSRRAGQDSEGRPVYRRDATGQLQDSLDEDLSDIAEAWTHHRAGQEPTGEYRFVVSSDSLDEAFRINPRAFRPSLNATLRQVEAIDERAGWRTVRMAELHPELRIFKGPRLRSDTIVVDDDHMGPCEPYYTPGAVLQEKCESAKRFDLSRASPAQLRVISAIRVQQGDIVISRSGAIGRISWIGSRFDGAIVSDDLIRVRVPDERLRWYLYSFLQSRMGQDQMLRNEYGSIQQHLEPHHVADLLIPIPDDWDMVAESLRATQALIMAKEAVFREGQRAEQASGALWRGLLQD